MKTFILSPLTLILISFLSFSLPSFGDNNRDSLYYIEIDGKMLIPKDGLSNNYKIELLCHNKLVESGVVVDDEPFLLRVKKNSLYTIRISKEGYPPLVISIDTRLPEYNTNKHKFSFDNDYFLSLHGFNLSLYLKNI